jgi:hypothetical protein
MTARRTLGAGVVLAIAGLVFLGLDVVPFLFGAHDRPLWLNLACLALPVGLALALGAAVSRGREAHRRAFDEAG